jgi:VanZ family protein
MMKWYKKRDLFALIIAILIAIFIFYMSSQSFEKGSPGPNWKFKPILYHFLIFFLFSFFLSIAFAKGKLTNKHLILVALLIGLAYSTTDELHQFFVVNRSCSLEDFFTDFIGILSATTIYFFMLIFRNKKVTLSNIK